MTGLRSFMLSSRRRDPFAMTIRIPVCTLPFSEAAFVAAPALLTIAARSFSVTIQPLHRAGSRRLPCWIVPIYAETFNSPEHSATIAVGTRASGRDSPTTNARRRRARFHAGAATRAAGGAIARTTLRLPAHLAAGGWRHGARGWRSGMGAGRRRWISTIHSHVIIRRGAARTCSRYRCSGCHHADACSHVDTRADPNIVAANGRRNVGRINRRRPA